MRCSSRGRSELWARHGALLLLFLPCQGGSKGQEIRTFSHFLSAFPQLSLSMPSTYHRGVMTHSRVSKHAYEEQWQSPDHPNWGLHRNRFKDLLADCVPRTRTPATKRPTKSHQGGDLTTPQPKTVSATQVSMLERFSWEGKQMKLAATSALKPPNKPPDLVPGVISRTDLQSEVLHHARGSGLCYHGQASIGPLHHEYTDANTLVKQFGN